MGKMTIAFIVPFYCPDPMGFAAEVLVARRREGYRIGEDAGFDGLLNLPNRRRFRPHGRLLAVDEVDMTNVRAVVEPDGVWNQDELHWTRSRDDKDYGEGLRQLLYQYEDHGVFLYTIRV